MWGQGKMCGRAAERTCGKKVKFITKIIYSLWENSSFFLSLRSVHFIFPDVFLTLQWKDYHSLALYPFHCMHVPAVAASPFRFSSDTLRQMFVVCSIELIQPGQSHRYQVFQQMLSHVSVHDHILQMIHFSWVKLVIHLINISTYHLRHDCQSAQVGDCQLFWYLLFFQGHRGNCWKHWKKNKQKIRIGIKFESWAIYIRSKVRHSVPGGFAIILAKRLSSCKSACSPK